MSRESLSVIQAFCKNGNHPVRWKDVAGRDGVCPTCGTPTFDVVLEYMIKPGMFSGASGDDVSFMGTVAASVLTGQLTTMGEDDSETTASTAYELTDIDGPELLGRLKDPEAAVKWI